MMTYGYWFYDELKDLLGVRPTTRKDSYIILHTPNHGPQLVKAHSNRLELFRKNNACVTCGRVGHLWILESHTKERPHLNLYHVGLEPVAGWKKLTKDGLVMMTKDHVTPKSHGGTNQMSNLVTMCAICNGTKGNKLSSKNEEFIFPHVNYENLIP